MYVRMYVYIYIYIYIYIPRGRRTAAAGAAGALRGAAKSLLPAPGKPRAQSGWRKATADEKPARALSVTPSVSLSLSLINVMSCHVMNMCHEYFSTQGFLLREFLLHELGVRSIHKLRIWISEGLTQAYSKTYGTTLCFVLYVTGF